VLSNIILSVVMLIVNMTIVMAPFSHGRGNVVELFYFKFSHLSSKLECLSLSENNSQVSYLRELTLPTQLELENRL
jgi:hypothetical protein